MTRKFHTTFPTKQKLLRAAGIYKKKYTAALMVFLCFVLFPICIFAAATRVLDYADLFTEQNRQILENRIASLQDSLDLDIAIVTIDDANGKSSRDYAGDFYDENGFGYGSDASGVLLLIDMDNREVYISTAGKAIAYLTDERIDDLLDDAFSSLSDKDYYGAAAGFLDGVETYVRMDDANGRPSGMAVPERSHGVSSMQLLLFLGISVIVGGLCCAGVWAKYSFKFSQYQYPFRENGSMQLSRQEDHFLYHTVTSRKIEKPSSGGSSGRSSVHTSSSGRSHGGGGRKF